MDYLPVIALLAATAALVLAYGLYSWVRKAEEGTERMKGISEPVTKGATIFLKREFKTMIVVVVVLFGVIGYFMSWQIAAFYVLGALFSVVASFFGTIAAAKGNVRTANAAMESGISKALKVAFRSGSVMGLGVSGLGLLGISMILIILGAPQAATVVAGFGLGASQAALFGRVSVGIFFKEAELEADEIGKAAGNTGGAAGLGADLFESYVCALISTIVLAASLYAVFPRIGADFALNTGAGVSFALLIAATGLIASMLSIMIVRGVENTNPAASLKTAIYVSGFIVILGAVIMSKTMIGNYNCAVAVITGLLVGAAISKITEIFTDRNHRPIRKIMARCQGNQAAAIVNGFGIGLLSAALIMTCIIAGIWIAHSFAGPFGIALAAVGMLSTAAIAAAIGVYCPVSNTAHVIAEMSKLLEDARKVTGKLSAVGHTAASSCEGFAISSAAYTAFALFAAYMELVRLETVNLSDPFFILGLFVGAAVPFFFSAVIINSTSSFKGMAITGIIATLTPCTIGIVFGMEVLGGMLAGAIASGVLVAVTLENAGTIIGGLIVGPFKSKTGSSVIVLIKMMVIISVTFASVFYGIERIVI